MTIKWLGTAAERIADFTVGSAIVMVHLVLADRQRRRDARLGPTLPPGRGHASA